jgi:hypothetical protein
VPLDPGGARSLASGSGAGGGDEGWGERRRQRARGPALPTRVAARLTGEGGGGLAFDAGLGDEETSVEIALGDF